MRVSPHVYLSPHLNTCCMYICSITSQHTKTAQIDSRCVELYTVVGPSVNVIPIVYFQKNLHCNKHTCGSLGSTFNGRHLANGLTPDASKIDVGCLRMGSPSKPIAISIYNGNCGFHSLYHWHRNSEIMLNIPTLSTISFCHLGQLSYNLIYMVKCAIGGFSSPIPTAAAGKKCPCSEVRLTSLQPGVGQ